MERKILAAAESMPAAVQPALLGTGGVLAAYGAWRLDRAYPLRDGIELFVGTPVWAWSVCWLGVGLVVVGLGANGLSALDPSWHLSDPQRSGLVVSGVVLCLPVVPAGLGASFPALLLLYITVPAGTIGVVTVLLWWLVGAALDMP